MVSPYKDFFVSGKSVRATAIMLVEHNLRMSTKVSRAQSGTADNFLFPNQGINHISWNTLNFLAKAPIIRENIFFLCISYNIIKLF